MIKMFDRTRRLRLLITLLVLASVTVVTIDFRTEGDGPLDKVGRAALTVLGPIQEGLMTIGRPIGNFFAGFTQVGSLKERITALEGEKAALRNERELIQDIQRENESLRALLDLNERLGFETLAAQVIGVSPSNFERTIFIDQGRAEGVRKDMPVLAGEGLAGRVVSVGRSSATVLLITDRASAVAARLSSSGRTGIIEGQNTGILRFELLDPATLVSLGDKVVTSGHDRGLYPSGIPVGSVVDVPPPGTNLSRAVSVQPFVDFSSLDHVLIVVGQGRRERER